MYQFDRAKAEAVLGALALSATERQFVAWWLELMQAKESILTLPPPPGMGDSIITFEIYDGAAYWLSAGAGRPRIRRAARRYGLCADGAPA